MLIFIYLKTLIFLILLTLTGIALTKRLISSRKAEILLPIGCLFGLSLFLFLVNILAYFVKGWPLFYAAGGIQLLITIVALKIIKASPLEFPKGKMRLIWFMSLIFWGLFSLIITNTSPFNGSDNVFYFSQASVFARGDFPIHTPWQPDYVSYSHLGISQLLAALRVLTGASYHFIHAVLAFISLFCSIQILTWILNFKNPKFLKLLLFSLPALIGFISLGAFMLAVPVKLTSPDLQNGFLGWLNKLPTIETSNASAGFLDPLIYILHRLVSTSFFLGILALLLFPLKKAYISAFAITIFLSAIALLDESVLISILPATVVMSFFSFNKKFIIWISFILISAFVISFQGGIVTESVINRYGSGSGILIFPQDNPDNPYENFRSFRVNSQSSTLFENLKQYQPFGWLQIGIIYQLIFLLICAAFLLKKKALDEYEGSFTYIVVYFFISSVTAFIAFHILVPKLFHTNGWRFLALSYQFSGIGIAFFLIYLFLNHKNIILKIIIIWILIFSIVPPFARLFPRRDDLFWFKPAPEPKRASFEWIKKNLSVEEKIIALTDGSPIPSSNIELTTSVGAFTPVWPPYVRAYENFDTSSTYADLFYTLNPDALTLLKAKYLIISNAYVSQLPEERSKDVVNTQYFKQVFWDTERSEGIFTVSEAFLGSAKNLNGTLAELSEIAPKDKTYYLDYESLQKNKNLYKATAMALGERKIYGVHDYWSRIEGHIPIFGQLTSYDYLILGDDTDPYIFCRCSAKLIWSGYQGGIKLWEI